jgi:hypothetical protein
MGVGQSADAETSELNMTEQQQQNVIAFLGLARTAIDCAELRIAGLEDGTPHGVSLIKAMSEINAGTDNLVRAVQIIFEYAESIVEKSKDASTVDRPAAGNSVVP